MILDAGVLISVDRGYDVALRFIAGGPASEIQLHATHPVVAQVWRGGACQARLAAFVKTLTSFSWHSG